MRSTRVGKLDVHHLDPYSQALSKVERGFDQDLLDVDDMVRGGLVVPAQALELFELVKPNLYRYPAIDPDAFGAKVARAFSH